MWEAVMHFVKNHVDNCGSIQGTCRTACMNQHYKPLGELHDIIQRYKQTNQARDIQIFCSLHQVPGLDAHNDIDPVIIHQLIGTTTYNLIESNENIVSIPLYEQQSLYIPQGQYHEPVVPNTPRATLSMAVDSDVSSDQVTYHWNDIF